MSILTSVTLLSIRNCDLQLKRNIHATLQHLNQKAPKSPIKEYNESRKLAKEKTPIKKWNEKKESEFWVKFDRWFEKMERKAFIPTKERDRIFRQYFFPFCFLTIITPYVIVNLYRFICQ